MTDSWRALPGPAFEKGWPHPSLLERPELRSGLQESFAKALARSGATLNYGSRDDGVNLLGDPLFLRTLAAYLSEEYGRPVSPETLMSTAGATSGIATAIQAHTRPGDVVVCEAPTYHLVHMIVKLAGLEVWEVPMQEDGMDLGALERLLEAAGGRVTALYTVPVHHNPTSVTLGSAKRERLLALARRFGFKVVADETYQLLNFQPSGVVPLFYHDDPHHPCCLSVGTFSKLVGPGLKVGWLQGHASLLEPIKNLGVNDSGGNPVAFISSTLVHFIESGGLREHVRHVSAELARRCRLVCDGLAAKGYEFRAPEGGYFVWVRTRRELGLPGAKFALDGAAGAGFRRVCFAAHDDEEIRQSLDAVDAEGACYRD